MLEITPDDVALLNDTDLRTLVNGLVVNMPKFEKAFFCKAGQPMTKENRCRIW
jgi:hypothetical protein